MSRLQSVRGMHDVLPDEAQIRRRIEQVWIDAACGFGYEEIRFPLVESTALFQRSIGETTDIVEKEMYTFEDRNGESLSLRPEGTAGCVRAAIQHGLIPNRQQRLWYLGSFFRHERPQKGRLRQFDQFGVETFGMCGPDIDAEILLLGQQGWQRLGLSPRLVLNTLGNPDERAVWRGQLVDYFSKFESQLEDDDRRRLKTNPLRLLDSKSKSIQDLLEEAPRLEDLLGEESRAHFEGLREILDAHGIDYTLNPRLVRGLDYYDFTVFEWVEESLGAQSALGGGGRYDRLVEQLGGRATPAAGFALGLERIRECLEAEATAAVDAYLVALGEGETARMRALAMQLRQEIPGLRIRMNMEGGSMKSQMRRADKSGAQAVLIMGAEELGQQSVILKFLRESEEQQTVLLDNIAAILAEHFAPTG